MHWEIGLTCIGIGLLAFWRVILTMNLSAVETIGVLHSNLVLRLYAHSSSDWPSIDFHYAKIGWFTWIALIYIGWCMVGWIEFLWNGSQVDGAWLDMWWWIGLSGDGLAVDWLSGNVWALHWCLSGSVMVSSLHVCFVAVCGLVPRRDTSVGSHSTLVPRLLAHLSSDCLGLAWLVPIDCQSVKV